MLHFARFPRPLRRERALASQHVTALADLPLLASGKVREIYDLGDTLLIVASDRISTYDVVHPTPIPDKGACSRACPRSGSSAPTTSSPTT